MLLGVQFNDTITLGAALIAAVGVVMALYRVALGARLRATNEIQGKEIAAKDAEILRLDREAAQKEKRLNQLGAEKDAALQAMAACEATILTLRDQLERVPAYQEFMDYGKTMMEHVDAQAAARQEKFMTTVLGKLQSHDEHVEQIHTEGERKAAERHAAQIAIDQQILEALRNLANGGVR